MRRLAPSSSSLAALVLLGALLGAAAPIAHAHLGAAGAAAAGLCGEPHDGAGTGEGESCSLCLANAQTRAVLTASVQPDSPAPALTRAPGAAALRPPDATRRDPAHPRAPPPA